MKAIVGKNHVVSLLRRSCALLQYIYFEVLLVLLVYIHVIPSTSTIQGPVLVLPVVSTSRYEVQVYGMYCIRSICYCIAPHYDGGGGCR
jgi:hypothetical protein